MKKREDLIGAVLIAPPDDYKVFKKTLGSRYDDVIKKVRSVIESNMENKPSTEFLHCKSARRLLSISDPQNFEARAFSVKYGLKEFSQIKKDLLILIEGSDEYEKNPKEFRRKLKEANQNADVEIIKGAGHSFIGYEKTAARVISKWLKRKDLLS